MSPEQIRHLQKLFKEVLALAPKERPDFLDTACRGDEQMRSKLEALLEADAKADAESFMRASPNELADALFSGEIKEEGSELLGNKIGPYTLVRRIGQGGMGEVFQAIRHEPFKQYVALKLIRGGLNNKDIQLRFQLERQILASLNHPNISRLLDGGTYYGDGQLPDESGLTSPESAGRPYLVMEYIEGTSITEYSDARRLKVSERLDLFREVCAAVHYAHQNLVIHRDLKPNNILVTEKGEVKLLDFGVAKLVNPQLADIDLPITKTGVRAMTPEYASPEQLRGRPLTTSSDIYSLGVVLYELLTGRRPYYLSGLSTEEVEELVCDIDPERPSTRVTKEESYPGAKGETQAEIPSLLSKKRDVTIDRLQKSLRGDIDNIVMMALRKEGSRRYASVEQMSSDIANYLAGKPVEARSNTIGYRAQKFVARHPISALLSAMVVFFLFAFGATLVVKNNEISSALETANRERDKAQEITGFLSSLFEVNNPSESMGDTLTARQILASGLERIDELDQQPEIQAEMLGVIGGVYGSLGMMKESIPTMERSIGLLRKQRPLLEMKLAKALQDLGSMYSAQGLDFEKAKVRIEESLELKRTLLSSSDPEIGLGLYNLSMVTHFLGDFTKSEDILRESIAVFQSLDNLHPTAGLAYRQLARVHQIRNEFAESDSLYQKSLDIARKLYGDLHPELAATLQSYGGLLHNHGYNDKAEITQLEARDMILKLHGEDHHLMGHVNANLADIAISNGEFTKAQSIYGDAISSYRRNFPGDPGLSTFLFSESEAYRADGNFPRAVKSILESVNLRKQQFGDESAMVVVSLYQHAYILDSWGKTKDAEKVYRETLRIGDLSLRPNHPRVGSTLVRLGILLERENRYAEAEPILKKAVEILEKNANQDSMIELAQQVLDAHK